MYLYIFLISIIFSLFACYTYILAWKKFISKKKIATGYGFILTIVLILMNSFFETDTIHNKFYILFLLFSFVYWFDDVKNLSYALRLTLQFFSGALLGFLVIENNYLSFNHYHIFLIIISGLISIFLTNVINFYDGSDLNISLLVVIISLTCLFLINNNQNDFFIWTITLGFVIGFIFFNIKPKTIFFGDSGCYVISLLLNFIIIDSILKLNFKIIYLLIPLSLPIVDVLYVILKKMKIKESLMTRNYYHLYHAIERKTNNKLYLLPQIFNSMIIYVLALFFFINDMYDLVYFTFLSFLVTIVFYIFIKKLLINIYDSK